MQDELARSLGVSQSTVSLALKGDPRVAKSTREAIEKKAAELGYVPDPSLVALSSYRHKRDKAGVIAGIAWITDFDTSDQWLESKTMAAVRKGVHERAEALGYQVSDFRWGEPNMSPKRLREILEARGIRGILFSPQEDLCDKSEFDFTEFAAVAIGHSLVKPRIPFVAGDNHGAMHLACDQLRAYGYNRIAYVMNDLADLRGNRTFSGGFLSSFSNQPEDLRIPRYLYGDFDCDHFAEWFDRWRPDAILAMSESLSFMQDALPKLGVEIGRGVALVDLDVVGTEAGLAGVDQQPELVGRAAVGVLHSALSIFEYGIMDTSYQTLIDCVWRDGESAPRRGG